jgi:hypothetical protein
MSHSARIRMPWPSSAQLTAISPSLVVRLPRVLTASVLRAAAPFPARQAPDAVGFLALANADAVVLRAPGRSEPSGSRARQIPGAAHSRRRLAAMRLAMTRLSAGAPKRMQTSKRSSVSGRRVDRQLQLHVDFRVACARTSKSAARWLRPKPSVAFTRNRPFGVALETSASAPCRSISPRMRRACSRYNSPSGVRLMRRVVRFTSGHAEACFHQREMLADRRRRDPSSRAAALRLPLVASVEKKPRSAGTIALAMAFHC